MNINLFDHIFILGAKYLYLLILGIAAIFFFKQPRDVQKKMAVYGLIALPIMYIGLKIAGYLYYDPRPFVVGHFIPLVPHIPDNGFPSDHTILSAAVAMIVLPFSRRWASVLWVLTLGVAVSRVYVGIHHPTDIIASILIAVIVGWIIYAFILEKVMSSAQYKKLADHYYPDR